MKTIDDLLQLIQTPTAPELGPGPRHGIQPLATLETAVRRASEKRGLSPSRADALRALVFLWHDHHDRAHAIVQDMPSADGSYIHAILHRREPDYANAKYWFHRVGKHPCYETLAIRAGELLAGKAADELRLLPGGKWDALAFVDACERAMHRDSSERELLRAIQAEEFRVLMKFLV